jgi:hypothetical protein
MLLLVVMLTVTGCGPSGKVASHNPTDDVIMVTVGSIQEGVAPGETRVFRWRGSPFTIAVTDESGAEVETVDVTAEKGQRWLFHHVGGDRCFGIADFGNLFKAGTDGALSSVSSLSAAPYQPLEREMDVWPGHKLPVYTETPEVWGMLEVNCAMTVDAANTHAAIHGRLHEIKPK